MYCHLDIGLKLFSTQVLYPITKKQRAVLQKSTGKFSKHLAWIQRPNARPEGIKEPGSRVYDLETKRIIIKKSSQDTSSKNVKKVEDQDPQDL